MSNRYVGKMIVCDTTDTQIGGDNPADNMPKGNLCILAMKWISTEAKPIIQNNDLNILWGKKAGTGIITTRAQLAAPTQDGYSVEFGYPGWNCNGLYVEDIDGGELQIFLA